MISGAYILSAAVTGLCTPGTVHQVKTAGGTRLFRAGAVTVGSLEEGIRNKEDAKSKKKTIDTSKGSLKWKNSIKQSPHN
jgi:hypothetical protein